MFYFNKFLNIENFRDIEYFEENEIKQIKKEIKENKILLDKFLFFYFILLTIYVFISTTDIFLSITTIIPSIILLIYMIRKSSIIRLINNTDANIKVIDINVSNIIFQHNFFQVKLRINGKEIDKLFIPFNSKKLKYAPEYLVAKNGYPCKLYLINKYLCLWLPEDIKDFGEI